MSSVGWHGPLRPLISPALPTSLRAPSFSSAAATARRGPLRTMTCLTAYAILLLGVLGLASILVSF